MAARAICIFAANRRVVDPSQPFSASNPFKQLLDISLNLGTYDSNFGFLDNSILAYNPLVNGSKRFEYIYDSSKGLIATQTSLDPPYQVRGIEGYTILGNNIGVGGSNCGGDPYCTMTSSGPAWLIASVATKTLIDTGTAQYFLQVGQNGILHAGANESVSNTYVMLGARDGPAYNARNDRERSFPTRRLIS